MNRFILQTDVEKNNDISLTKIYNSIMACGCKYLRVDVTSESEPIIALVEVTFAAIVVM